MRLSFVLSNFLVLVCCFSQLAMAQSREAELASFFAAIDKNEDISGSALIAENGKIVYQKSFGYADIENQVPNTSNTVFQIASVSKVFTAIAVVQLYEQKKLDLTDKFSTHFPDFPYKEITIRHLLSMTSGIPNTGPVYYPFWETNRDTFFTLYDVIPALNKGNVKLNFNPGETYEYSNTNYELLALLVEKISGEKFDKYLSKHIFKPAKMTTAFQSMSGSNPYTRSNVAYNYAFQYSFSKVPSRVDSFPSKHARFSYKTPSEGSGGIYCSANDLLNFHKALFSGVLLKKNNLTLIFSPSTKGNGKKFYSAGVGSEIGTIGNFYWGMGNRISLDSTLGKIVWESGGMTGARANVIHNLTKNQVIIWLDNKESKSTMNNVFGALDILNGKSATVKKGKKSIARIFGQLVNTNSGEDAFARMIAMTSDTANYIVDENELNEMAYEFYENNKPHCAFEILRAALYLFPLSDNLYNSYGELLAKSGRKEEAIIMYKKSIALNPQNEDSIRCLNELEKK
jgi:CubicO group peptidase (beta-lactamase class C family)